MHTLYSDRLSLASGSLATSSLVTQNHNNNNAGTTNNNLNTLSNAPLTAQQLGTMGMESLENVITFWEDALTAHEELTLDSSAETEFIKELEKLLDVAYGLQEQGELLFLDQRSVLFRGSEASHKNSKSASDPNLDSAESFASALDQVADLREFEEFTEGNFPHADKYPLYQTTCRHMEEQQTTVPCRTIRTELVHCTSDSEYLAKLHCLRMAFRFMFKEPQTGNWISDTGRQILTDLMCLGDKDPKDFLVAYEDMLNFITREENWPAIERELELRNVKAMTFYDIVLDFIILDAFRDLDSPPASVIAVVQNRFLSNGFKETALCTAVWSVLRTKKRLLKFPNGFMSHFYMISEQISPLMAWGFFGPDENLKEVCKYFREQTLGFLSDIFSFQKCRYTTVEELSEDIVTQMRIRVENISVKFSQ